MKILTNKSLIPDLLTRLILTISLLITALPGLGEVRKLDEVVAIVDDDIVLASELEQRLQQVLANINRSGRPAPPVDQIRRDLLDQLIVENIQLQIAHRAGVRIGDAQLNDAMTSIARKNNFSLAEFQQALEADGMSYAETREQVRREIMLNQVQQGSVRRRVQITEQEIENFLGSEEGKTVTAPDYRLIHTLIAVPSNADQKTVAKAKAYAEKLYQRIQSGESYTAVTDGSHPYNVTTSDLGWRPLDDLPSLLIHLPDQIQKGETAPPFQSPSGFHLVKMQDTRGASEIVGQTHGRHILLKPSAIRDETETLQQIRALRQRILKGEDFSDLARQFSEDIGSAQEGGDLGWTSPGQLVEEFQRAMDDTAIGDISPPVKSTYGWHIVQVLDRRQKDISDQKRRNAAYNFIYERKFNDELQAWLQEIRDEAYVDIK